MFLSLGSNVPIAELEFWLAVHWAPDLYAPSFTKSSRFQRNWLGLIWLNPAALSSRPWIYGNCGHPTSPKR